MKKIFKISGMHCRSCEKLIENNIKKLDGIKSVRVSYANETAEIEFDENKIDSYKIIAKIIESGYEAEEQKSSKKERGKNIIEKLFRM